MSFRAKYHHLLYSQIANKLKQNLLPLEVLDLMKVYRVSLGHDVVFIFKLSTFVNVFVHDR